MLVVISIVIIIIIIIITVIIITITIYYHVRSSGNIVGKILKFAFLYVHLQPKHEEEVSLNSRQRHI